MLGDYAFLLDETARRAAAERLRQAGVTGIPELIAFLQDGLADSIRCAWLLCLAGVAVCAAFTLFLPGKRRKKPENMT